MNIRDPLNNTNKSHRGIITNRQSFNGHVNILEKFLKINSLEITW